MLKPIIYIIFVLNSSMIFSASSIYQNIAQQYGIDGEELYKSIYQKTSYLNEHKQVIPWPWTVYVNNQKFQFKNKIDMFNYLIKYQTKDGYEIYFGFANQPLEVQSRPLLWQQLDIAYMLNTAAAQISAQSMPLSGINNKSSYISNNNNSTLSGINTQWDKLIQKVSQETGVDALLLYAMVSQESGGKKEATSHKGAMGLMQLMPNTANSLGLTPDQYYDPYYNLKGGVRYIRRQIEYFGDLSLALAAYNAGPNAVIKYGNKIPPYPETQHYVKVIKHRYASLKNQKILR